MTHNTDTSDIVQFGKWLFAAIFVASLVTANLTASKLAVFTLPIVGEVVGSVAVVMIAVSFLMSDLCSEIYGRETTRMIVNASIIAVAVAFGFVAIALSLPAADAYESADAFDTVFNASYPILIASIISLLISQNLDVSLFHRIRSHTGSKHKWVRNIGSTGLSQLFDTAIFTWLAFAGLPLVFGQSTLPTGIIVSIIATEYLIKLICAFGDTVIFYLISGAAERCNYSADT